MNRRRGYTKGKGVPASVAAAIARPEEGRQLRKLRDLENPRIIARHPFADPEANR